MENFEMPLLSKKTESDHVGEPVHGLQELLTVLREEEDYYEGEQNKTKLMITRLRKIYYDKWGWDSNLIRGAKDIETRYMTTVQGEASEGSRPVRKFKDNQHVALHRVTTYTDHDRVYGASRVGEVPLLGRSEYQIIKLPDGYFTHFAHTLGCLDAFNYPAIVTPFPPFLSFLAKLGPHADHNTDVTTWLDDLAQICTDYLFDFRKNKQALTPEKEQAYILKEATGPDMISDIDAYVIAKHYDIGAENGQRLSDIIEDYYTGTGVSKSYRDRRASIFCEMVGLTDWDGNQFGNEKEWIHSYNHQLKNATCFQVNSVSRGKFISYWLPLLVWSNRYRKVIKTEMLLTVFVRSLKDLIHQEPTASLNLAK